MPITIKLQDGNAVLIKPPFGYTLKDSGVYYESGSQTERLCDPIWIDANIRYRDDPLTLVRIKFQDIVSGEIREHYAPRSQLVADNNVSLVKKLMDLGAGVEPRMQQEVLCYLQSFRPSGAEYAVKRIGWFTDTRGFSGFALPSRVITPGDETIYLPAVISPEHHSVMASCSIEEEKANVSNYCKGNPYLLFVRGLSLSAPFLSPLKLTSGGFNFYGLSSKGKTTMLQLGASVWGNGSDPEENPTESIVQRWNSTSNALEGIAQSANDIFLPLDEVGTNQIANMGSTVYNLAGGVGKSAMTSDRQMREAYRWKTQIGSSGEYPIEAQIDKSGSRRSATGQRIRMIDIALPDNVFPDTGGMDIADFVDQLKSGCADYYGASGEAMIRHLVDVVNNPKELCALRQEFNAATIALNRTNLSDIQRRAAKRFAVVHVALRRAVYLGLIDISLEEVENAVVCVFDEWISANDTLSDVDRGIESIKHYITTMQHRFRDAKDGSARTNGKIVGFKDLERQLFIIMDEEFSEVCGTASNREVLRKLDDLGHLFKNNTNNNGKYRMTSRHRIGGLGTITGYAVRASIFGPDDSGAGPMLPDVNSILFLES